MTTTNIIQRLLRIYINDYYKHTALRIYINDYYKHNTETLQLFAYT